MATAFGPSHRVVAINGEDVRHYDAAGVFIEGLYGSVPSGTPRGMCFDNSGNLYIAFDNDRIDKFAQDGTGPTTIYSIADAPFFGPRTLETDGTNIYFATSNSNTTPRIVKLSPTGTVLAQLVTIPDEGGGTTIYDDNPNFGISTDGLKLYGHYGNLTSATQHNSVFETVIASDATTKVYEAVAADPGGGIVGEFRDVVPLADGTFAVMSVTGSGFPEILHYSAAWVLLGTLIAETATGTIQVGAVEHQANDPVNDFLGLSSDIMTMALSPCSARLVFPVRVGGASATSQIWEYDLATGLIAEKYATGGGQNVRSFAVEGTRGCCAVLLLGSDNGHIYRRVGNDGAWTQPHTMSGTDESEGDSALGFVSTDPTDLRRVVVWSDASRAPVHSADAGATWAEVGLDIPVSGISAVRFGGSTFGRDAATGDLYHSAANLVDPWTGIVKSTDNGATWTVFYAATPGGGPNFNGPLAVWIQDGWIFWTEGAPGGSYTLFRMLLDGTGQESLATGLHADFRLSGGTGSARVYAFRTESAANDLLRIDTATGAVTTLSAPAIDADHSLQWIVALTGTRAILHSHNFSDNGKIWLTDDGGDSWSELVSDAELLQLAGFEAQTVARREDNTQQVAVIGSVNHYWESTNARTGSPPTFTKKDVSPQDADGDFHWVGIGYASTCAAGGGDGGGGAVRRRMNNQGQVIC